MKKVVDIITMGCSKNLVDSEHLIFQLGEIGYKAYCNPDSTHGGIAVVNTCGFIEPAKEESVNMILELCKEKEEGKLERVYVMGCLSQRYRKELEEEIPQVDRFFGKFDWKGLADLLKGERGAAIATTGGECGTNPAEDPTTLGRTATASERATTASERTATAGGRTATASNRIPTISGRALTTPGHYAYIKISEGCDRRCAYCAIPIITGRQASRSIGDIVAEVREMAKGGVREFQIIAQDCTSYGTDIYGRKALPELVERLAETDGVDWIRVHYAYPDDFPENLLRVMREHPNVCKYLDIALQHIDDSVLRRMHRNITGAETISLINGIRAAVPGIALRTTLMVGFPGETDEAFRRLKEFVSATRFERLGAFAYSEEDGTYAARHYTDDVSPETKQARLDEIMMLQQSVSEEICASRTGKVLRVIIDRKEGGYFIGRTEYDSPEVDGEVLVDARLAGDLTIGEFYDMRITASNEHDLIAEPANLKI